MNLGSPPHLNVVSSSKVSIYYTLTILVYGRQEENIVVIQQRSPVLKVMRDPTKLITA